MVDDLQGTNHSRGDDSSGPHQTSSAQDDSDSDDPNPGSLAAKKSTPVLVDSSTQVPDHDRVKEEQEDKKTPMKEIKKELGTVHESPEKGDAAEATPTVQDPNIKEEAAVKEDIPAIVPDGASSMDLERGIEKPTEVSHQAEVLSPILSSRGLRPRTAPAAPLAPGEPSALMQPVAPSPQVRLFHQLDTRVAAPTLLHKLLPDPDLGLNSLLKFEGPLKEVHDANYNGVSTTGDYAGKFRNRIPFVLIKFCCFSSCCSHENIVSYV